MKVVAVFSSETLISLNYMALKKEWYNFECRVHL
jgi:hypothetical protein